MYPIFSFVMTVLCYAILRSINSLMGPIHNARTGDYNDSIKPRSSISAPGWCIDRTPARLHGAGRWKGRWVEAQSVCTDTVSSLIYFRSALVSSWPRPQLLSAADLAPVLMKKQGNSTKLMIYAHAHTQTHTRCS